MTERDTGGGTVNPPGGQIGDASGNGWLDALLGVSVPMKALLWIIGTPIVAVAFTAWQLYSGVSHVSQQVQGLDGRIVAVEEQIESVESQVDEVEAGIEDVEDRFDERIDEVAERLARVEGLLESIQTTLNARFARPVDGRAPAQD